MGSQRLQEIGRFIHILALFFVCSFSVLADSAGPNSPSVAFDDASVGSVVWKNVNDVLVSDNKYSDPNLNDGEVTHYLVAVNFSFSIPENATINGILAEIEHLFAGSPPSNINDSSVRIIKGGSMVGTDKASADLWPGADTYAIYGGSSDLWGTTWTAADINNAGFGVAVSAKKSVFDGKKQHAKVDHIRITVYYTAPDTTPPNVTVPADMTVEATGPSGAVVTFSVSAVDDVDGPVVPSCSPASGSPFNIGDTVVVCTATDSSTNVGIATFTITVEDTTPPVLTLPANITEEATSPAGAMVTYSATANDLVDGAVTPVCVPPSGLTFVLGTTSVSCIANDSRGNTDVGTFQITVQDTTPPVITLLGSDPVDVEVGSVYTDDGATALDNYDGDLTASIITVNPVDTGVLGTYIVTYDVNDSSGNPAVQVTRTVNVVDTTAPVITLVGSDNVDVEVGSVYTDDGATALDNYDGDLTASIITVNPVDTNTLGTYTVTYDVADSSGNPAVQVTRTVNVVDTTPPEIISAETQDTDSDGYIDRIILTFNEEIDDSKLASGTADGWDVDGYDSEAISTGADANDNILFLDFAEGAVMDTGAVPNVHYAPSGGILSTHDLSGNELEEADYVPSDKALPVLFINGNNPETVNVGDTYADAGVNASEEGTLATMDNVNTSIAGTYNVAYDFVDNAGNAAVQVVRTVNVVDVQSSSSTSAVDNQRGYRYSSYSVVGQQAAAPSAPAPAALAAPAPAAPAAPAPAVGGAAPPAGGGEMAQPSAGNEITGGVTAGNQITG
ncbi:MAG: DUF5011 domain-containing protein, partial [Candidatus Woesearchaeota archaeon]